MAAEEGAQTESYAGVLMGRLNHAPCLPSHSENRAKAEELRRQERIEPELVAATSNFGRFVDFHPTKARVEEDLPDNLYRSSATCYYCIFCRGNVVIQSCTRMDWGNEKGAE